MSRFLVVLALLSFSCNRDQLTRPFGACTGFSAGQPASLEGRLHYDTGAPAAGLKITLDGNVQVETDAGGQFVFPALETGVHTLQSTGISGEMQIAQGRNYVDFPVPTYSTSGWAAGRVLDACTGRPIAGAKVGNDSNFTTTAADGTFNKFSCCNTSLGETVSANGYATFNYGSNGRIFQHTKVVDYLLQRAK